MSTEGHFCLGYGGSCGLTGVESGVGVRKYIRSIAVGRILCEFEQN